MPRPELELGEEWEKQILNRALARIEKRLEKEPLTENEIWTEVVGALGAEKGVNQTATRLRQLYNLRFKRKISRSTANLAVVSNLKSVALQIKQQLSRKGWKTSKRVIQFGKDYHGQIYYKDKNKATAKAEDIIINSDSTAAEVLRKVNERGYVYESELPYQRRLLDLAADLLKDFGLAQKTKINGRYLIHKKGFDPQSARLEESRDIPLESAWSGRGWRVEENFSAGTWVLGADGPRVKKFKFDLLGFDPKNRQLHLAVTSDKRLGKGELDSFRVRALEWGLPAVLHAVAPEFTSGAQKYARTWGIELETR